MTQLSSYSESERTHLLRLPCPEFKSTPYVQAPSLDKLKVSVISTTGLHSKDDLPFGLGESDYRLIPSATPASDLVMSHISTNFDRTGFQMDLKCPVNFSHRPAATSSVGELIEQFAVEMDQMRSWYDIARKKKKPDDRSQRIVSR